MKNASEKLNKNIETDGEFQANVWEKYGKARIYIARNNREQAGFITKDEVKGNNTGTLKGWNYSATRPGNVDTLIKAIEIIEIIETIETEEVKEEVKETNEMNVKVKKNERRETFEVDEKVRIPLKDGSEKHTTFHARCIYRYKREKATVTLKFNGKKENKEFKNAEEALEWVKTEWKKTQ